MSHIVTFNLKDFPSGSLNNYSIAAIHPDQFLILLCDEWGTDRLKQIIYQQSNALKNPQISAEALLEKQESTWYEDTDKITLLSTVELARVKMKFGSVQDFMAAIDG